MKEWKQPTVVIMQQVFFLQCIYSVLVAKNHPKIRSRCLVYEFSFTNVFNDINHDYRAVISKGKLFVAASVLYDCGYPLLL